MDIRLLTSAKDLQTYDTWVKGHSEGSLWQSLEWKQYQEALGRETTLYGAFENQTLTASALVIKDRTVMNLSTWDIPRGPLGATSGQLSAASTVLEHIVRDAQKDRVLSIFLSPDKKIINYQLSIINSGRHIYPEATRILDLTLTDEALLAQMHPKGRYNIRLAEKHGVHIEQSSDVAAVYPLLNATALRDGFTPLPQKHYQAFLDHLPGSFLLLAHAQTSNQKPVTNNSPIAGLLGVIWNGTGIYYYGASDYEYRSLMAPYALQWAAMQSCRARGCRTYDLLGIAPEGSPDHLWTGVSAFKEKFGGTIITYPPEQEITLRPTAKTLLGLKRRLFG